jgi:galactokinase
VISPLKVEAVERFETEYGRRPQVAAFAPGRVNLIGGHVDYNNGLVLPIAIEQGVYTLLAARDDGVVRARSLQVGEAVEFRIGERNLLNRWDDALRGVVNLLKKDDFSSSGLDILFSGDVPLEAGLSSSAAFVISAALAIGAAAGRVFAPTDLALFAQRVENEFMGVACGVLDQMASAAGKSGHALLLDCGDLSHRQVPFPDDLAVIVCHTGVTRTLAGSKYNERRSECEQALGLLRETGFDLGSLREVTLPMIEKAGPALGLVLSRRVRHQVTENQRVRQAVAALEAGDEAELGRLLSESHASLRDDYQVSCPELDAMTSAAKKVEGCLGSRLVGAGFGGCAIALIRRAAATDFMNELTITYTSDTGRHGRFFAVFPGNHAGILRI